MEELTSLLEVVKIYHFVHHSLIGEFALWDLKVFCRSHFFPMVYQIPQIQFPSPISKYGNLGAPLKVQASILKVAS